jgi:hypothetical protein
MQNLRRFRFTAPVLHACLFTITGVLAWISSQPILDGPARFPFAALFVADFPISAIAFGVLFTSQERTWFALGLWGIVGTLWWYFLGRSIEAWISRASGKK